MLKAESRGSRSSKGAVMALAATFGADTLKLINKSKVLVVGAGGIGCELLKNLVSSGFKEIETVWLTLHCLDNSESVLELHCSFEMTD